jgi:hypothetical protein
MVQFTGFTPQLVAASAGNVAIVTQDLAVITTPSLSTAAAGTYTLTVQSAQVKLTTVVLASVGNGTNGAGTPAMATATVAATQVSPGTITIVIQNIHASAAFNGTLQVFLALLNG